MQFRNDTPKAPNINLPIIAHAKNHLWRPVISALNIGVDGFALKAAGAEIDDTDAGFVGLFEEDVLGFEVGVDYFALVEEVDGVEDLEDEASYQVER